VNGFSGRGLRGGNGPAEEFERRARYLGPERVRDRSILIFVSISGLSECQPEYLRWIRWEQYKRYHAVYVNALGVYWTYCGKSIRPSALVDETGQPAAYVFGAPTWCLTN
jgi:hypothetical protein